MLTSEMVIEAIVEASAMPTADQLLMREKLLALCALAREESRIENDRTLMRLRMPSGEYIQ